MSRALLLALCLAAAWASPEEEAATLAAAADDAVCEAGDVECALSLRQLRAAQLVPDADGDADAAAPEGSKDSVPSDFDIEAEQNEVSLMETSLQDTLQRKKNMRTLYHLTSPYICTLILEGGFKPGSNGWCGGAIYFATSVRSVWTKAVGVNSHTGCLLRVQVDVGKIRDMGPTCDVHMTQEQLYATHHDSIRFNPGDGIEFVIFDAARVKGIKKIWQDPKLGDHDDSMAPVRVDENGKPVMQKLAEAGAAEAPEEPAAPAKEESA